MKHPFEVLKDEYTQLIARATIIPGREKELELACNKLLKDQYLYEAVSRRTDGPIPVAVLMALSMREMSGDTTKYLGNGEPLGRVTTLVPKGRGPFKGPNAFVDGALDALRLDGLAYVKEWSLERAAYEAEVWNGPGYRNRGIPSPYVFGATKVQQLGKFTKDGVFNPKALDTQLGVIAIIEELFKLRPSLKFGTEVAKVDAPSIVPQEAPSGLGSDINVFLLQQKLNDLAIASLKVDGVYGRDTIRAVKAYQFLRGLDIDGMVGPKTMAALNKEKVNA